MLISLFISKAAFTEAKWFVETRTKAKGPGLCLLIQPACNLQLYVSPGAGGFVFDPVRVLTNRSLRSSECVIKAL